MSDVAAHLVQEVFPEDVPMRQWVCSLPWSLRYVLGYDRALCADVLRAFIDALKQCLRRRAKREFGLESVKDAQVGAVTVVQRSDSALRLNVHFHTLAADGVWVRDGDGGVRFRELPPPTADDVAEVASRTHQKLLRVLARHGRELDGIDDVPDRLADEQPVLASCYGASASDVSLLGERAGQRTGKLTGPVRLSLGPTGAVAEVGGVNVHAKVRVEGWDRRGLERLCRYIARPPLALERLSEHGDGRLRYTLKSRWRDGTSAVLLEPLDLIARLCALIPAPRFHTLRYHGVFAGNAKWRGEIVPGPTPEPGEQLALLDEDQGGPAETKRPRRHPWAWLLSRVFGVDIIECPRCGGRLRVVEVVSEPADIARVLQGQGARAPPPELLGQLEFDFAA